MNHSPEKKGTFIGNLANRYDRRFDSTKVTSTATEPPERVTTLGNDMDADRMLNEAQRQLELRDYHQIERLIESIMSQLLCQNYDGFVFHINKLKQRYDKFQTYK